MINQLSSPQTLLWPTSPSPGPRLIHPSPNPHDRNGVLTPNPNSLTPEHQGGALTPFGLQPRLFDQFAPSRELLDSFGAPNSPDSQALKELQAQLEAASEAGDLFQVLALTAQLSELRARQQGPTGSGSSSSSVPSSVAQSPSGSSPSSGNSAFVPSSPEGSSSGSGSSSSLGSKGGSSFGPSATAEGPAPVGQITPDGTGEDAVKLARKYLGHNSIDIKGKMPHFTAAGGQTNNCVDFVSSALEATGRVKGHHINVQAFEKALKEQGYVAVPQSKSKPGDVWINNSRGHTELISKKGGTHTIGSNNDRPGHQVISERAKPEGQGVVYQLREKPSSKPKR